MNNKKINWYRVEAVYYTGYGANLRKLRGVPKKSCEVLASCRNGALEIARIKHDIKESLSLNAGYMVSATKLKRPAIKYQDIKSNQFQISLENDNKYQIEDLHDKTSTTRGKIIYRGSEAHAIGLVLSLDPSAKIN